MATAPARPHIHTHMDEEDVQTNPLFRLLRQDSSLWTRVQNDLLTVCVPVASSLAALSLTQDLLHDHILQDSPFFLGQFHTLSSKTVMMATKGFVTGEGFANHRSKVPVPVVAEESFYNEDMRPFKVLLLKWPLGYDAAPVSSSSSSSTITNSGSGTASKSTASSVSSAGASSSSSSSSSSSLLTSMFSSGAQSKDDDMLTFPSPCTLQTCTDFLQRDKANAKVLVAIAQQVAEFNDSFVIVKGFTDAVLTKVHTLASRACISLLQFNSRYAPCEESDALADQLKQVVATYVVGSMHSKIFSGLRSIHDDSDRRLRQLCETSRRVGVTQADLGVEKPFRGDQNEAVALLDQLDLYCTPCEKAACLASFMQAISDTVATRSGGTSQTMATDDLLPLVLHVLLHSQVAFLYSELVFLTTFAEEEAFVPSLFGFHLVTFQAAIEYLLSDAFQAIVDARAASATASSSLPSTTSSTSASTAPAPHNPHIDSRSRSGSSFSLLSNDFGTGGRGASKRRTINNGWSSGDHLTTTTSTDSANVQDGNTVSNGTQNVDHMGYEAPPTVIGSEDNDDDQLGDFLSSLKNTDDWDC